MQCASYKIILFLILLYENSCKELDYEYGDEQCPCEQFDLSCLVVRYLDDQELKLVEKCVHTFQAEDICNDYRSELANILSCKVEPKSFEDLPKIDIVKRDIPSMWYEQINSIDIIENDEDTSEEPGINDSTTESEIGTSETELTETDSTTGEISTTTPETTTSVDEIDTTGSDEPITTTTSASTTEGSVTRTPRPYPNRGNKLNLAVLNPLFCAVTVLCLKLTSVNIY